MWARIRADGIEVHRDSDPRSADALDVVDFRPAFDPATQELAGPRWRREGGRVHAVYDAVPRDVERDRQTARDQRIAALRDKALAILADPAGPADWTAAERRTILALLVAERP